MKKQSITGLRAEDIELLYILQRFQWATRQQLVSYASHLSEKNTSRQDREIETLYPDGNAQYEAILQSQ